MTIKYRGRRSPKKEGMCVFTGCPRPKLKVERTYGYSELGLCEFHTKNAEQILRSNS